ncbi:MAG: hypothetical protein AB7V13_22365 [Pseudorhodoplanes sp.]|uniref:DUF6969 family protein n=1 Tax=Pseudorhodoplanes sp. TaxID=1934341 RepID=UPI003D1450C4
MAEAGITIVRCIDELGEPSKNLVLDVLRGSDAFVEWDHYPSGDVYDEHSGCQYYFHAHAPDGRAEKDFGHFHTFIDVREKRRRNSVASKPRLTHLVGISMTPTGFPVRLFTTNRWVTGEVWRKADQIIAKLDRFAVQRPDDFPADRWLTAMIRLFRPQIEKLLIDRDLRVKQWQSTHPNEDAFEDTRLEVTSQLDISLFEHIEALDRELDRRGASFEVSHSKTLGTMFS